MIPRVNFHEDYKETCFESNDCDNNSDYNYSNIGLSLNSQELIRELHQALFDEEINQKKFEEIVYSILEDIQKYKRDYKRLEIAYKNEKDRYEESIRQMVDEAEQQLFISTDKIKKAERLEAEKLIERLKEQHEHEISSLQMSLNKMISLEKKYHEDKIAEDYRQNEFKKEIQNITDEKKNLTINLREYQTQISILRSEIAQLKSLVNEKDVNRAILNQVVSEKVVLESKIDVLQDKNRKLSDTNDILKSEIDTLKTCYMKKQATSGSNIASTPIDTLYPAFINDLKYAMNTSIGAETYISDDEDEYYQDVAVDSGIWQDQNEMTATYNVRSSTFNDLYSPKSKSTDGFSPLFKLNKFSEQFSLESVPQARNNLRNTFPHLKDYQSEDYLKLVFAGDSAVGKTSFIMKYCKGEFSNATSATLGVDFYMKSLSIDNTKDVQLQLWDTCGQERFRSIAKSYFRRADGVVLMYDVTCEQSFLNVREWIQSINDNSDRNIPIIIIGNKTDLREQAIKNNVKVIDCKTGYKLARQNGALFIETSIKDGQNIDDSLFKVIQRMKRNQELELKYFLYYFS